MADFTASDAGASTGMPFTQFILEADARQAREHPDQAVQPFAETGLGKLIIEQETRTAQDYADGKISAEEFETFRGVSQAEVDSVKEHIQETLGEISEEAHEWAVEVKDNFNEFKEEHPGVVEDVLGGNPTVANAAAAADLAGEVIEPVNEIVVEGARNLVNVATDELIEAGSNIVEARAAIPSVDRAEVDSSQARLETAVDEVHTYVDAANRGLDEFADKSAEGMAQYQTAVGEMAEYGEQHPEAHVLDGQSIEAPDVQQAIEEETPTAEA